MAADAPPVDPNLYKMLVEQARDYAVFALDKEGRILTWNTGAQRIKGYAPEEIIGRHFSVFYPHESVASGWPAHELKVAAAEGRFEDEGWRVRKDGSRFWASVIITALRDEEGKLLGFSKITRDLTDRRLHEEALRQSEERFRLMIEGVVDYAIYMLDAEGVVTSWNAGAQRIKGYTREDIIGKHFSRFYPPGDLENGKPWEELAIARRIGRTEDEGWRVRKDGSRFWARTVLTALHDEQGHLRGYAKVTQDLTDRRHAQDLEQATRNMTEFIAVLAHELRNPLAPIRNAVHLMGKTPADDPSQKTLRELVDRQSRHLARIVDDILDIARITRGSLAIERERVDIADAARRAIEMTAPLVEANQHQLEVELPGQPIPVRGDLHRLTQVLGNLLNNAARYTPRGGRIWVTAARENNAAVVKVRDNGVGLDPGLREKIFDMFVQGRSSLERIGGGLGVGLALARKIAELHGGALEAYSEGRGHGTEFTLRLPLDSAQVAEPRAPAAEPAKASAARRVLVVDDNVDAATMLELLLRSLGHETRVVYDGASALKVAAEFHPDIVLLDIGMPGLDGYEVARRLRTMKDRPRRIIAVTGWGQPADRQRSHEAGFDRHLVKPVEASELARILDERNGATLH
jgi:PAS domain S-box-containing protein